MTDREHEVRGKCAQFAADLLADTGAKAMMVTLLSDPPEGGTNDEMHWLFGSTSPDETERLDYKLGMLEYTNQSVLEGDLGVTKFQIGDDLQAGE